MTCRKTKEFLSQKKLSFSERDFFQNKFSRTELTGLLRGKSASEGFNFKSPSFKALGKEKTDLKESELIDLMLQEPRFIRRPVVKIGDQVYFGADSKFLETVLK